LKRYAVLFEQRFEERSRYRLRLGSRRKLGSTKVKNFVASQLQLAIGGR
jgi:hypothetical protein